MADIGNVGNSKITFAGKNESLRNILEMLNNKTAGHSHSNLDAIETLVRTSLVTQEDITKLKTEILEIIPRDHSSEQILALAVSLKKIEDKFNTDIGTLLEKISEVKKEDIKDDTAFNNLQSTVSALTDLIKSNEERLRTSQTTISLITDRIKNMATLADVAKISRESSLELLRKIPDSSMTVNGCRISDLEISEDLFKDNKISLPMPIKVGDLEYSTLYIPESYIIIGKKDMPMLSLNLINKDDVENIVASSEKLKHLDLEIKRPKRVVECVDITSAGSGKIITKEEREKLESIQAGADKSDINRKDVEEMLEAQKKEVTTKFNNVIETIRAHLEVQNRSLILLVNEEVTNLKSNLSVLNNKLETIQISNGRNLRADLDIDVMSGEVKTLIEHYTSCNRTVSDLEGKLQKYSETVRDLANTTRQIQRVQASTPAGSSSSSAVDTTGINNRIDQAHARIDTLNNKVDVISTRISSQ